MQENNDLMTRTVNQKKTSQTQNIFSNIPRGNPH